MWRVGYHKQVSARGSSWNGFMKYLSIGFHLRRLGSNMTSKVAIMFNNNAVALSFTCSKTRIAVSKHIWDADLYNFTLYFCCPLQAEEERRTNLPAKESNKWEISGFLREVEENWALLSYYVACGGDSLQMCWQNGKVRLSRNVGRESPSYAAW
jgi:hypothetical protein